MYKQGKEVPFYLIDRYKRSFSFLLAAVKVNGKSKAKAGTKVAWLSLYVSAKQPQVFAYKLQMSANSEHGPNQGGKKVALVGTVNTFFVFRNGTVYMRVHVPTRR